MKSSRSCSLTIILVYIVVLPASVPLIQCDDLIDQICKKTPFYDLCMASLGSNSESSGTDVKGLASIMANIVLSNTTDTLTYIQQLIKQNKDPQLEKPLADCAELYIPVVKYNLPQAIDALSKDRYGFAKYVFSDASKQADACEKGFSGATSPLTDLNKLVSHLCDVAVSIITVLLKG